MRLVIKTDFDDVRRSLASLREDIGRRALASALNKTVAMAKTRMGREIRSEFNVTPAYVRERLQVKRATFRAAAFEMAAELVGGKGLKRSANVIAFTDRVVTMAQIRRAAKQGKKPQMQFRIKRGGPKKQITGAFVGNKGQTVFVREGKARLPIKPVQTIDVAQMFNARRINGAVLRVIRDELPRVFANEARFFVQKMGGR